MRSPKSRSRSKQNRNNNRSVGNVLNRVFDSSGPEGKVRGTPQQIIDKYNQLARDAQLSNDRVATENFQQHAEHYLRLLAHAQKEQEARREQQEKENRGRNADRERNRVENGSDISAGNVSDLEKDSNATSAPMAVKTIMKQPKKIVSQRKAAQALMTMTGLSRIIDEKETIIFNLMLLITMITHQLKRLQKRLLSS